MELKENSRLGKFYKWFYSYKSDCFYPSDGCEFSRKMIIAFIFCIPLFLLTYPQLILEKINNKKLNTIFVSNNKFSNNRIEIGIILQIIVFYLYSVIIFLFHTEYFNTNFKINTFNDCCIMVGIIISLALLFILICALFVYLIILLVRGVNYIKEDLEDTTKKSSILSQFIKAKKEKYCFKIDWKK